MVASAAARTPGALAWSGAGRVRAGGQCWAYGAGALLALANGDAKRVASHPARHS